jgi:hypothetical protein
MYCSMTSWFTILAAQKARDGEFRVDSPFLIRH